MLISACEHYRWAAVFACACCLTCGECKVSAALEAAHNTGHLQGGLQDRCDALLLPQPNISAHGHGAAQPMHAGGSTCLCGSGTLTAAARSHGRLICWQPPCLPEDGRCWQATCSLARQLEHMRSGRAQEEPPGGQLLQAFRVPGCREQLGCREAASRAPPAGMRSSCRAPALQTWRGSCLCASSLQGGGHPKPPHTQGRRTCC